MNYFVQLRNISFTAFLGLKRGIIPDHAICREGYVPNLTNMLKEVGYTHEQLPYIKTGGRDLITVCRRAGGGKRHYVLVDRYRTKYGVKPFYEKVIQIINNYPLHSAHLALVAGGIKKRWIVGTENMKIGDVIKSSGIIPRMPVRPIEGEAHPLGALPVGTFVNSVEKRPGWGANWAMAAGTSCQILKNDSFSEGYNRENNIILQLPSKQEVSVNRECIATVGKCSNVDFKNFVVGGPVQKIYLGYRPRSGLWHRKDGTCGRKIRPLPPVRIYDRIILDSNFHNANHIDASNFAKKMNEGMKKSEKRRVQDKIRFRFYLENMRNRMLQTSNERLMSSPHLTDLEKMKLYTVTPKRINLEM